MTTYNDPLDFLMDEDEDEEEKKVVCPPVPTPLPKGIQDHKGDVLPTHTGDTSGPGSIDSGKSPSIDFTDIIDKTTPLSFCDYEDQSNDEKYYSEMERPAKIDFSFLTDSSHDDDDSDDAVEKEMEKLDLSDEFLKAIDMMENTNKHISVTGRPGTGKTTLLKYFVSKTRKSFAIVSPTGVAAQNAGGTTIHSFFKLRPTGVFTHEIADKHRGGGIFKKLQTLIIDEISMVRADLFDAMHWVLTKHGPKPGEPFGGVQVIIFGDLHQIPPVVGFDEKMIFNQFYDTPYFFSSIIYTSHMMKGKHKLVTIEHTKNYRQTGDQEFIKLLENMRENKLSNNDFHRINQNSMDPFQMEEVNTENHITLTSTNKLADDINQRSLAALDADERMYTASINNKFDEKLYPTEKFLKLIVGAKIMLIRNNHSLGYVNGTLGQICALYDGSVAVKIPNKNGIGTRIVNVEPAEWESNSYEVVDEPTIDENGKKKSGRVKSKVVGTFTQLPIRLGYAITVHKSQGATFDGIIINMGGGGAFAHGQTYVAFSRCRTLDGVILQYPVKQRDIIFDERVIKYMHDSTSPTDFDKT